MMDASERSKLDCKYSRDCTMFTSTPIMTFDSCSVKLKILCEKYIHDMYRTPAVDSSRKLRYVRMIW